MPANLRLLFLALLIFAFPASSAWCAPKLKVLHSFGSGSDGAGAWSSLVFDTKGNLYGTTSGGGQYFAGTVFELSPQRDGNWNESVLYNFCSQGGSGCTDGAAAFGGPTLDKLGNVYGTTQVGGADHRGVVYELTSQDENWTETVLYSFDGEHGGGPFAGVTVDPAGNLYGTAGGVYELSPGSGGWSYSVLYGFGRKNDGSDPRAGVIRDSSGNLYGTTVYGGGSKNCAIGCGTVYRLHPGPDGAWRENILHDFGAPGDGDFPGLGALTIDAHGNLYDTTDVGGRHGYGTVFRLTPTPHGHWRETILQNFNGQGSGGLDPSGVVMDKAGVLYGTTGAGGAGCGFVYKLAPAPKGKWGYTVLHTFTGTDGCTPAANLILDSKGNLYGTTVLGGTFGGGVAFELTP